MIPCKALAIGGIAGCLGSLAGMGGGFVMIPLMTSRLLRLTQHEAHGTSLFAVAATGIAGALSYFGEVQWEVAAVIAGSGMVTARFGAIATSKLSETALRKALGVFMLLVAPLVPAKSYFEQTKGNQKEPNQTDTTNLSLLVPAVIGCGSGFMAGLFGVGGGAVVVPALVTMTDLSYYEALGTSLCAMSLPAIVGTLTHYTKGNVAKFVAPPLAIGAFCGAYCGGKLGQKTNESSLRWGFAGLMTVLGVKTLIRV